MRLAMKKESISCAKLTFYSKRHGGNPHETLRLRV